MLTAAFATPFENGENTQNINNFTEFNPLSTQFSALSVTEEDLPPIIGLPQGVKLESTLGYQLGDALHRMVTNVSPLISSVYSNVSNLLYTATNWLTYNEARNIKKALKSNKKDAITSACQSSEIAENICTDRLNDFLNMNRNLTTKELDQLDALLPFGLYSQHDLFYTKAILSADIPLAKIVSPHLDKTLRNNPNNPYYFYYQLLEDPHYKKFADEFSLIASDPILVNKMKDMIEHHYEQIIHGIQTAREKNIENKPLLILMGEQHRDINSFLSEVITIFIAKYKLNIDIFHSEIFPSIYYKSIGTKHLEMHKLLENIMMQIGLKYQAIDLAACKYSVNSNSLLEDLIDFTKEDACKEIDPSKFLNNTSATSSEGLSQRNKVMVEELIKGNVNRDALALVGAAHLEGMLEDENLQNHFYTLAIDFSDIFVLNSLCESPHKKCHFLALEQYFNVLHPGYCLPNVDGLYLTLEEYIQIIKNIVLAQNQHSEECKEFESFFVLIKTSEKRSEDISYFSLIFSENFFLIALTTFCILNIAFYCNSNNLEKKNVERSQVKELSTGFIVFNVKKDDNLTEENQARNELHTKLFELCQYSPESLAHDNNVIDHNDNVFIIESNNERQTQNKERISENADQRYFQGSRY